MTGLEACVMQRRLTENDSVPQLDAAMTSRLGFCLIRQPSTIPIVRFSPNRFPRRFG
jgi:hypothetical protein